jgi:hypothetical protein
MTETELKIHDAKTQIKLAETHIGDEAVVRSCINSFISLARSVTFVMQAESGGESTQLGQWYRAQMISLTKNKPLLLKFFNARRVYSIHKGTVTLQKVVLAQFRPAYIEGIAQLKRAYETYWFFDETEDYELLKSTPALCLCSEYLELLEELVASWLVERINR